MLIVSIFIAMQMLYSIGNKVYYYYYWIAMVKWNAEDCLSISLNNSESPNKSWYAIIYTQNHQPYPKRPVYGKYIPWL